MKSKLAATLLALGACAPQVHAEDLSLRGFSDCKTWTAKNVPFMASYVYGFISGLVFARVGKNEWTVADPMHDLTAEQVNTWMDKFCVEHPESNTVAGSAFLFMELTGRKGGPPR